MEAERILKTLTTLSENCKNGANNPCIKYSVSLGGFFFDLPCCEIKKGITLTKPQDVVKDTIEEAAKAIINALAGQHLVFNAGDDEKRREVLFYKIEEGV